MKSHHYLKTIQPFFDAVRKGIKSFEVRFNDRKFKVGDYIHLEEYNPNLHLLVGGCVHAEITYILDDPRFCKEGYVVFEFKRLDE